MMRFAARKRRATMGAAFVCVCVLVMLTSQPTHARITREDIRRAHLAFREKGAASPVGTADLRCDPSSLPSPPEGAVKFFALGDWGVRGLDVGSDAQLDVARGISCAARANEPRFIVTLGDNFYPKGVVSEKDGQFSFKYEEVYTDAALKVPWFPSLGDHDHLGDVNAQALYSLKSDRWSMPSAWYVEVVPLPRGGKLQLIFVDWVALEGKYSESDNDRRFQKHLGEAAGKDTSEEHWEWLRRGDELEQADVAGGCRAQAVDLGLCPLRKGRRAVPGGGTGETGDQGVHRGRERRHVDKRARSHGPGGVLGAGGRDDALRNRRHRGL